MTLLQIIQTIAPDKARLIDEILTYSSEVADKFHLGDGEGDRESPNGWDINKLVKLSIEGLQSVLDSMHKSVCIKSIYYIDFTGDIIGPVPGAYGNGTTVIYDPLAVCWSITDLDRKWVDVLKFSIEFNEDGSQKLAE